MRSDQVTQVRGYADQMLRVKDNPFDPSNRRVSILVKNQNGALPDLKGAARGTDANPPPADQQKAKAANGAAGQVASAPAEAKPSPLDKAKEMAPSAKK